MDSNSHRDNGTIPLEYYFDPCVLIHMKHKVIVAIYVDDITTAEYGPPRGRTKVTLKSASEQGRPCTRIHTIL